MKAAIFSTLALATLIIAYPLLAEARENIMNGNNMNGTATNTGTLTSGAAGNTTWSTENTYWRNAYPLRPYYNGRNYSAYEPAYHYGVDLSNQHPGTHYNDLDPAQVESGWAKVRGNSNLNWIDAQMATRDAYDRLYETNLSATKANLP